MNVSDMNLRVLQIMSMALSGWARQIDAADVQTLARECGVDEREAVIQLFAAQCGVEDREKIERYFRLSIEKVDADAFLRNPYLQTVRFPRKTRGRWKLDTMKYQPYELFVRDELLMMPDGREIPRLGYFDRETAYPAVLEDGREWMTVTPNEIATMEEAVRRANGHVVAMGLGLGYFAFRASEKPEVARVTVVERDPDVIALSRRASAAVPEWGENHRCAGRRVYVCRKAPARFRRGFCVRRSLARHGGRRGNVPAHKEV